MELFILRHGKAEARAMGTNDADRALTGQGREEIKKIGRWTITMGYTFEVIATSPLKRAMETAEIIGLTTGQEHNIQAWDLLSPGGDLDALSRQIASAGGDGSVLIVGHEPMLSTVMSRVISGNAATSVILAKGAFARIKNVTFQDQLSGDLHSLITPKQLPAIH
ncbi:MAG: phosphohistidine phosphatase SixA [Methanomicrobiales archaeon]